MPRVQKAEDAKPLLCRALGRLVDEDGRSRAAIAAAGQITPTQLSQWTGTREPRFEQALRLLRAVGRDLADLQGVLVAMGEEFPKTASRIADVREDELDRRVTESLKRLGFSDATDAQQPEVPKPSTPLRGRRVPRSRG